ncbi:MAG: flagellin lysine-N-methylase [Clostridia bacterium]|nr:flagellin lysine-N-methylase [Clostridia bacterium]
MIRFFKQGMDFKCIASKCTDSCCTGWDITFDKTTYEHLSKDPCFKETMADFAYSNDTTSRPNINYGIISCEKDERCPFLDTDDLCTIQKKKGEDALSNVCALYPRYYNTVDGIYEESLSLACIEATEKLLFRSPLELVEIDRSPKRDLVIATMETQNHDDNTSDMNCLYEFRKHVFELLKNPLYTFNEKLGMLLIFHEYIETIDKQKLKLALENHDFGDKKINLGIDENTHGKLLDFLKKVGQSGHNELDTLITKCLEDSDYHGLQLDKLPSIDGVMSNYLIHQMFKELYPFINMHNKMDAFQYLLKKVQILRLLIAYDGHFDDQSVARMIQMYSKGLEHHAVFHYELEDLKL